MSSSPCQWTTLRPLFFSSLLVLCFVVVFFTYHNFEVKFPSFNLFVERAGPTCPTIQCAEVAQTQGINCSTELQADPHDNGTQEIQEIQEKAVDTEPDTILLIWTWPFGLKFDLSCSVFNIERCLLTDDRNLYHKAHGIIFHHRDIQGNLANMPSEPRPWFQKWVWFNMESPANSAKVSGFNSLFNLTSSYRLDSHIPVPYGSLEVKSENETFSLPKKDKLVCWVVSNWSPNFRRVDFYDELKKHIDIHTYGKAFDHGLSDEEYKKIVSSCKFYLSFENSVYKDYITEKLHRPMMLGTVPVVLGPSRQNYEEHIPGDSFIHVDDFSEPKELAERLQYLDQNTSDYMRYFDWKNGFITKMSMFGKEHACKACGYLQKNKGYQAFHDLNKWYWGEQ